MDEGPSLPRTPFLLAAPCDGYMPDCWSKRYRAGVDWGRLVGR